MSSPPSTARARARRGSRTRSRAAFIDLRGEATRKAVSRALVNARAQLARQPKVATTEAARETLRTRISSLEAIRSLAPGGAEQIDQAAASDVPFAPQPRRAALFAFALSLVFAMLVAYGLERLDRRVRHLDEVMPAYGVARARSAAPSQRQRVGAAKRSRPCDGAGVPRGRPWPAHEPAAGIARPAVSHAAGDERAAWRGQVHARAEPRAGVRRIRPAGCGDRVRPAAAVDGEARSP